MWQLSEGQKHVSFRDSQLTRLLKPALGGDSKTALVCCFSPHEEEESRRTLEFAKMSRKVVNSARVHLRADACQVRAPGGATFCWIFGTFNPPSPSACDIVDIMICS